MHADLKNNVYKNWMEFLQGSATWSDSQIETYQKINLKRIIGYAYHNTKGYRNLFDRHGLDAGSFESLQDIRKFPYVEKEMIRDHLEDFSATMPGRTYVTTGGSTGIPFGMYRDPEAFHKELASKAFQYYRIGWKEGDRQIVLRGIPIENEDHIEFVPHFNELRFSSYHLTADQMEIYRKRSFEYKPQWLRCYPSSGYILARWLQKTGKPFPSLKGILCASENLYEFQKKMMQNIFNSRVFSHYGHYELAVLAGYCEKTDDYHVLPQYGFAELIDSKGRYIKKRGDIGEIIGTSFIMHATPFIRYRTCDLAAFKGWGCEQCGRPYQIWERIEGRLQEFVVTGDGRYISMTAMNFHDDIFDHLKQFQFFQEVKGRVILRYIPKHTCSDLVLQTVKDRLLAKMGKEMYISFEKVNHIPLTKRGKNRFLIQKMDIEFHDP